MSGGDKRDALPYTMPVRKTTKDVGRVDCNGKPFDHTTVSRS